ncbi:hypothetical protein MRX96_014619, partial [Rhipicephalus microplus]
MVLVGSATGQGMRRKTPDVAETSHPPEVMTDPLGALWESAGYPSCEE